MDGDLDPTVPWKWLHATSASWRRRFGGLYCMLGDGVGDFELL